MYPAEHAVWSNMKQRCYNPKARAYNRCGARGIKVCDRWLDFKNFIADLGKRPDSHYLTRDNADVDYGPETSRWGDREKLYTIRKHANPWKFPSLKKVKINNSCDRMLKRLEHSKNHVLFCPELKLIFKTSIEASAYFKITRERIRQVVNKIDYKGRFGRTQPRIKRFYTLKHYFNKE